MAELQPEKLRIGDRAPPFRLPGTDGALHGLSDFGAKKLLVVVFSCNHCPYAQAWEGRLIELDREFDPRGVGMVVINPNETEHYPDDRMERMAQRAKQRGYPFPYLRDDSQEVAHAYGALVTPHAFVFDEGRRLIFQGRVDDHHEDPRKVKQAYLRDALESGLAGRPVPMPTTSVLGCTVKWKS